MSETTSTENSSAMPPPLRQTPSGDIEMTSLAALIEWFLNFDEKTAIIRHPIVERIFQWKQADDAAQGNETQHFPHTEDRLAIGIFQALGANETREKLHGWISNLLEALNESKRANTEIAEAYGLTENLDANDEHSPVELAEKLPGDAEKRVYLTACWYETLCTAEIRILGWIYQQLYRKPFQPQDF